MLRSNELDVLAETGSLGQSLLVVSHNCYSRESELVYLAMNGVVFVADVDRSSTVKSNRKLAELLSRSSLSGSLLALGGRGERSLIVRLRLGSGRNHSFLL